MYKILLPFIDEDFDIITNKNYKFIVKKLKNKKIKISLDVINNKDFDSIIINTDNQELNEIIIKKLGNVDHLEFIEFMLNNMR